MVWKAEINQVSTITNVKHKDKYHVVFWIMKFEETNDTTFQDFRISEFGISRFTNLWCENKLKQEVPNCEIRTDYGPNTLKFQSSGFLGFAIQDFVTLDATFIGLRTRGTQNAEKGLNGSWPFHILGFCDS